LQDNFSKGVLPFSGSLSDQPNHIIEILKLIEKLKFEYEQELKEKKG